MTPMQLDLLAEPAPLDREKDAVLALIAGDPIHARDRAAIVDAIRASVRPDGTVSSNDWRPRIPTWCYPAVVGATVNALAKAGVLIPTGQWVTSDDRKGRNTGKPSRSYFWRSDASL